MSSLAATEQKGEGARQHRGLLMAQTFDAAAFGHLPVHDLPEAAHLVARHLAGRINPALMHLERLGQMPLAQLAGRVLDQLPHIQLFGLVMGFIEILRHPFETRAATQHFPASGLVGGAAKEPAIDETFHRQEGMAPAGLPVFGEAGTAEAERARGQIGQWMGIGQDDAAGVMGQKMAAARARVVGPAEPSIAGTQVPGRSAPAQQGQPGALECGDGAEVLADERGVLQR